MPVKVIFVFFNAENAEIPSSSEPTCIIVIISCSFCLSMFMHRTVLKKLLIIFFQFEKPLYRKVDVDLEQFEA